jgi:hypothetical protein
MYDVDVIVYYLVLMNAIMFMLCSIVFLYTSCQLVD